MHLYAYRQKWCLVAIICLVTMLFTKNVGADDVVEGEETHELASDGLALAKALHYPPVLIAAARAVARIFVDEYDYGNKKWHPAHFGSGVLIKWGANEAAVLSAKHIPDTPSSYTPQMRQMFVCNQFAMYLQFGNTKKIRARIISYNFDGDQMLLAFDPRGLSSSIKPVPIARRNPRHDEKLAIYGFHFGSHNDFIEEDVAALRPVVYVGKGTKWGYGRYIYMPGPGHGTSGGALFMWNGYLLGTIVGVSMDLEYGTAIDREETVSFLEKAKTEKPYCPGK